MAADRAAAARTDRAKRQTANNAKLQGKHLPHRSKEAPQAEFFAIPVQGFPSLFEIPSSTSTLIANSGTVIIS